MIEILRAIKTELWKLTEVRDRDVFITPHIGFIPQGTKRPCIGIKDGKVEREYLPGKKVDILFTVRLALFCDLGKKESFILGAPGAQGILALRDECVLRLDGNFLNITGMQRVRVIEDPESELFLVKNGTEMQRKIIGLRYELRR